MKADASEVELLRSTFRDLLTSTPPAQMLAALAEGGWHELEADDPEAAVALLFLEQGRTLASSAALDLVVARAAGIELEDGDAVVHAATDRVAVSGATVNGVLLAGAVPRRLLVPTDDGILAVDAADSTIRPVSGIDPALGLRAVQAELGPTAPRLSPLPWSGAAFVARRALAYELTGVAESMLEFTIEQVATRQQYGRAIGSFQAVQHRLADVQIAVDAARAVVEATWREADGPAAQLAGDAAKALAGRAGLLASKHCQQVCGAIGFTVEHPLPRHIARAQVLDVLYGSSSSLQEKIGGQLVSSGVATRLRPAW